MPFSSSAPPIYGLRVAMDFPPGQVSCEAPDVHWSDNVCDAVAARASTVSQAIESDGAWTYHSFGRAGIANCEFAVSPDGRRVISRRDREVNPRNLFNLFAEPVMRTILTRLGLLSFHGAVLARAGMGILLLGESGAGKSTVAGALMRDGWTLLTDDLARLYERDGAWFATPGLRQLKLHSETVRALALDVASVGPRWADHREFDAQVSGEAPALEYGAVPKYVLHDQASVEYARIGAIYLLGARRPGPARIEALSAIDQIRGVLMHRTPDPTALDQPPSESFLRAVPAILRQAPCFRLTMPSSAPEAILQAPTLPWLHPIAERTAR